MFEYVRALQSIGVKKYDSYLTDVHSEYFGGRGYKVVSSPAHEELSITETSDSAGFLRHLKLYEQGEPSYIEMSGGLAASGVEKWSVNTGELTMIYYDKAGNEMLVESIE